MKNIGSKTDGTSSLPAASFNSLCDEAENFVTEAGLTLDVGSETTPDPNPTQMSQAMYMAGRDADAFTDSGSANSYTLTKIRGKAETAYRDGARFRFVPANTNTGASTVNIQAIGSKNIRFIDNSVLGAGAIQANKLCEIYYDLAADNFKLMNRNTASAGAPGELPAGVYDAGVVTLTSQPTCAAYKNAAQTGLTSGNAVKCQFNIEEYDIGSFYDNATNYRIQPTKAGKYLITWTVRVFGTAGDAVRAALTQLYKNGAAFKNGAGFGHSSTAQCDSFYSSGSAVVDANGTTDYFEILASATVTSSTWVIGSGQQDSFFTCIKIS